MLPVNRDNFPSLFILVTFISFSCLIVPAIFEFYEWFVYFGHKCFFRFFFSTNIFSWSVACIFIFLTVYFSEVLIKPNLQIFSSMDHVFGILLKNSLPKPNSARFSRFLIELLQFCILLLGL